MRRRRLLQVGVELSGEMSCWGRRRSFSRRKFLVPDGVVVFRAARKCLVLGKDKAQSPSNRGWLAHFLAVPLCQEFSVPLWIKNEL